MRRELFEMYGVMAVCMGVAAWSLPLGAVLGGLYVILKANGGPTAAA